MVVISLIVSVVTSFFLMRHYSKTLEGVLGDRIGEFEVGFNEFAAEFEKTKPTISKAYGLLSSQNITPRQVKVGEKMIAKDIMEQYPEVQAVLGAVSPRTMEYFTDNPDILMEIISRWGPKIQAILGEGYVEPGSLGGLYQGGGAVSRSKEWAWKE